MSLVSICMPVYNRSKYVAGAIKSCLNQRHSDIELIIVDDASKDDTYAICRNYARKDKRIKLYINKRNIGTAASFNKAFRASASEYICMIGSDDYMSPESIEGRVNIFTPELDMVIGTIKTFLGSKNYKWCRSHKMNAPQGDRIQGHAVMFRRRVFEKYGLFYSRLRKNEDEEYWFRLGLIKKHSISRVCKVKYIKVPVICAYVRFHKGSTVAMMKTNIKLKQKRIYRERIEHIINDGITDNNTEFL